MRPSKFRLGIFHQPYVFFAKIIKNSRLKFSIIFAREYFSFCAYTFERLYSTGENLMSSCKFNRIPFRKTGIRPRKEGYLAYVRN